MTEQGSTLGPADLEDTKQEVASVDLDRVERWMYHPGVNPDSVQYMAMNTPVEAPAEQQCGLTAQNKVPASMIFDISACIESPID